jgi:raffinose/stachyose/melibiose transport system permease protein
MKKNNNIILTILKYIFIFGMLVFFIGPFLMIIVNSMKENKDFYENPILLPNKINFENFVDAFEKMDFINSAINSLIITFVGTMLIIIFASMMAYRFVRNKSYFNNTMFFIMIATMIIPFQAVMIPLVGIYGGKLHMLNNKWILIYMYLGFGISQAVFMYHGFIKGIPIEIEEAATIDGCSEFKKYYLVILPLLKPITITIAIIDILWIWNDYLLPTLVLGSSLEEFTLPLSTYKFYGTYSADYTLLMASLIMIMIPVLILYVFLQKYIIDGITQGSIK